MTQINPNKFVRSPAYFKCKLSTVSASKWQNHFHRIGFRIKWNDLPRYFFAIENISLWHGRLKVVCNKTHEGLWKGVVVVSSCYFSRSKCLQWQRASNLFYFLISFFIKPAIKKITYIKSCRNLERMQLLRLNWSF